MNTRRLLGYFFVSLCLLSCRVTVDMPKPTPQVDPDPSPPTSDLLSTYIVVLNDGVIQTAAVADEMARQHSMTRMHVYRHAIKGFSVSCPAGHQEILESDPRVSFVVEDQRLQAFAQTLPTGVDRINADRNATASIHEDGGDVNVDIALIDTGIDLDHPDLNVFKHIDFTGDGSQGDDGNGHGTHVAGVAAARDNSIHTVGVAPGARLWSLKSFGSDGYGYLSDVIAAIDYVTEHSSEIDVVNLSFGGPGSDDGDCGRTSGDVLHEAICNAVDKGLVFVAAAGNDADNAASTIPAAYDEVVGVSAIADSDGNKGSAGPTTTYGSDDSFASFSNFGPDIDLAAPGVNILSLWLGGGTKVLSGTSVATPHVTGAAALYIVKNGKPSDSAGVTSLIEGLVALGYTQDSENGFSGDGDGHAEPLVNVEGIDPAPPPTPGVGLHVSSDKSNYVPSNGEATAQITAVVSDENDEAISDLVGDSFSITVDGTEVLSTFSQTTTLGTYRMSLSLSNLTIGIHTIEVSVTDSRNLSDTKSISITISNVVPPPPTNHSLHISSIRYESIWNFSEYDDLIVWIEVKDDTQKPVENAYVSLDLFFGFGNYMGSAFGTTDVEGKVHFVAPHPPLFCYYIDVTWVFKSDFTWAHSEDVHDPGFCKVH